MQNEVLLALLSKLVSEKVEAEILNAPMARGPRGYPGVAIEGPPGRDGKDFVISEHEDKIKSWINEYSLKFQDLSLEEIEQLRGPRGRDGRDGRDGKDLVFESLASEVYEFTKNHLETIKSDFKLKFEDLDEGDIKRLRGPRGQRGAPGKSFVFDEHREKIDESLVNLFNSSKDELKLKFQDLSLEEKDSLKLKFENLSAEEINQLRGPRGQRGKTGSAGADGKDGLSIRGEIGPRGLTGLQGIQGQDGRDGRDGQDAPYITDVKVDQWNNEFKLIFEFSDGTYLDTDFVTLPKSSGSGFIVAGGSTSGSGSVGPAGPAGADGADGAPGSQYYFGSGAPNNSLYLDGDIYQNTVNGDQYKKIAGVWVLQDNITGPQGPPGTGGGATTELITNIDCESDVYVGAAVYMKQSTPVASVMTDWSTLSGVTTMDFTTYVSLAANALANDYVSTNVIGLVESKESATKCTIRISGITATNYFSLDVVDEYYLSDVTPGGIVITENAPTATGHVLLKIGQPINYSQMLYQRGERIVRA